MCGTTFPLPAGMLLPDPCYPSCSSFRHLPHRTDSPTRNFQPFNAVSYSTHSPEIRRASRNRNLSFCSGNSMVSDTLNYILVFRKRKSGTDEQSVLFLTDSPPTQEASLSLAKDRADKAPAGVNSNQRGALCAVGPVNLPVPRGGGFGVTARTPGSPGRPRCPGRSRTRPAPPPRPGRSPGPRRGQKHTSTALEVSSPSTWADPVLAPTWTREGLEGRGQGAGLGHRQHPLLDGRHIAGGDRLTLPKRTFSRGPPRPPSGAGGPATGPHPPPEWPPCGPAGGGEAGCSPGRWPRRGRCPHTRCPPPKPYTPGRPPPRPALRPARCRSFPPGPGPGILPQHVNAHPPAGVVKEDVAGVGNGLGHRLQAMGLALLPVEPALGLGALVVGIAAGVPKSGSQG